MSGEAVVGEAVKSLRDAIADVRGDSAKAAGRLSELVIAPLTLPAGISRLAIIAEGALEGIPFGVLPDRDGGALLAKYEIVGLPSASVLSALRTRPGQVPPAARTAFVVADPVFDRDDPRAQALGINAPASSTAAGENYARLFFAGEEARAIMGLAGERNTRLYSGFDARREVLLLPEARNYRIHHLATHLVLDAEHPELSRMVFSLVDKKLRPADGFLYLHDIYNLDLPSELVVLSACRSGLGEAVNGEGLIGFTRGMLLAGAHAVAVSMWTVNDEATAELMKRFYQQLLKYRQKPSTALRLAQLEMMRQTKWRKPYYWAGFTLYGDWR